MTKPTGAAAPEIRAAQAAEIRADAPEGVKVSGYAAVYNEAANIGGLFMERIAPGAFDDALGDDLPFLVNHEGLPLARTGSGTLTIRADDKGLYMETVLDPADPDVARIVPKMKRGDLSKMSFAFTVAKEEWDESGEIPMRTITRMKRLYDVSIVTNPAYAGTDIGLRSLEAHRAQAATADPHRQRRMRMQLALTA